MSLNEPLSPHPLGGMLCRGDEGFRAVTERARTKEVTAGATSGMLCD